MPFKMTYKQLFNEQFASAFKKLRTFPEWKNAKLQWNINRIARQIDQEIQAGAEQQLKMVKEYCKLDEKGNIVPDENRGPGSFTIPEANQEAWKKATEDFDSVEFTVESYQIPMEVLEKANFSANDLGALEPMLIPVDLTNGLT